MPVGVLLVMPVFVRPSDLDRAIGHLGPDVEAVRQMAGQVRGERARVSFSGPRAERFFGGLAEAADELERRGTVLEAVHEALTARRAAMEEELAHIKASWRAAEPWFRRVEAATRTAWEAHEAAVASGALTEAGLVDPPTHPKDLYVGWRYAPHRLPTTDDQEWRAVNAYLHTRSGTAGVRYDGPSAR